MINTNSPKFDEWSADVLDILGPTNSPNNAGGTSPIPTGSPMFFKSDSEEQRAIDSAPLPTPVSSSPYLNFSTNVMSESAEKAKMFMFGQNRGGQKPTSSRRKKVRQSASWCR